MISLHPPHRVGLIDYGAGNIQSLRNALEHVGGIVSLVHCDGGLKGLSHLVLPGVGAFGHCMERLKKSGMLTAIEDWALDQCRPTLGICVGMQMLADSSQEQGRQEGLGWIGGEVTKLSSSDARIRIPHVGWNSVQFEEIFGECNTTDLNDFYFDHSYAYRTPIKGGILANCVHGEKFCAVVRRDNIVGSQFHPEKSQAAGMRFLRSFLAM